MSYCVNCGVELDDTAQACPLCHTPVLNPNKPVDMWGPKPFPTEKGEVPPAARGALALLISAMLLSVAVCCGVLNLFLRAERAWSLYIIGASVMLWIWFVLPLLLRLPGCVLGQIQNNLVDEAGQEERRAEALSVFNMSGSVLEVIFLVGSSAVAAAGPAACFGVVGLLLAAAGWISARRLTARESSPRDLRDSV